MNKIDTKIIKEYKDLQANIKSLIKMNGLTIGELCSKANINRRTFDRKVNNGAAFDPDELKRICEVLNQQVA